MMNISNVFSEKDGRWNDTECITLHTDLDVLHPGSEEHLNE